MTIVLDSDAIQAYEDYKEMGADSSYVYHFASEIARLIEEQS